jgi:signal transduction histidine kinase
MLRRRSKPLLVIAFASVCTILIGAQLAGYFQWRRVRGNVDELTANALSSIRLVQRMGLDIERERILIDRHIFAHERDQMTELELQIANVEADFDVAAINYVPIAVFPGEAAAWHRLTFDAAALAPRVERALEFSRENADADAQLALSAAESTYDAVELDVDGLVAINQAAADRSVATIEQLQIGAFELRLLIASIAMGAIIVLAIWVTRAITRREAAIETSALALENRNRELDAFAGRVAHDLRGPLTTIKLSGSLLAECAPGEPRTAMIFQRGITQMEQLIEDLLTLSRLDSEAVGRVAETANVAVAIADDLGRAVRDAGGKLGLELRPARIRCSEGLLRQLLWNLGENAVKYRREDVPLELVITGVRAETEYVLRVTDNGKGMTPNDARAAFEPFYRSPAAKAIPGTGLGLAIVRRIVEASGGRVSLESVAGRGTTVDVRLPLSS